MSLGGRLDLSDGGTNREGTLIDANNLGEAVGGGGVCGFTIYEVRFTIWFEVGIGACAARWGRI